jgi:multidrug efflux pump subunit AcrA (membrane-fusion protein)
MRNDRWVGARLAARARETLQKLLGFEHTTAKLIGIVVAAALGVLVFGRFPHWAKAPAILRTENVSYITAPFDGHLERVLVRVGDEVAAGSELLSLDRKELLLREAELIAEKNRHLSELEKARATNALADMRIAQGTLDQSQARHDLVRFRLSQATVTAPWAGVVVEGDLMERVGSPVRQGDTLLKLAQLEDIYAELEVDEKDIQYVRPGLEGEIAFASRPQDRYVVRLSRAEPVALPKEKGNVFLVRAALAGPREAWWRPGMTGVARLRVGERSLLWIVAHRTVDFLRLRLWW